MKLRPLFFSLSGRRAARRPRRRPPHRAHPRRTARRGAERRGRARARARGRARAVFERMVDPVSGHDYYFNNATGASRWTKPWVLGSEELPISGEDDDKVLCLF